MKKLLPFLVSLLILANFGAKAQVPTCSADVPYFFVDMTGAPDSVWVSPGHSRQGNCCGTTSPDRCTSFDVILDPGAAMINLEIASGSIPPGSMFYQINCGPQIPVGQPICMVGTGPFHVTFCKPGNNQNTYRITSIPKPTFPPDANVRIGCSKMIETMGMVPSTITWTSIYPGTLGQYNSYLSCTSGCAVPMYTPAASAPAYVEYRICGAPIASTCGYVSSCDTVRIYNLPSLSATVTPASAFFCSGGGGVLLTAHPTGGNGVYSYIWKDDHGTTVGTGVNYNATAAGIYTLEVRDGLYDPSLCPAVLLSVPVTVGLPPVVNAGPDQTVCASSPTTYLAGTYSNATGGVWTGGSGTYSPNNTTANATYTPTAAELAAGSVTLTFTSTGAGGGCSNASDVVVITYPPLLSTSMSSLSLSCNNSTSALSPTVSGGVAPYSYNWNTGATSSSITVGAGNYCVSVTDSKGCSSSVCANVIVPPALNLSLSSTDATTIGGSDGTATATVSGGTAPYTYSWSPGGGTTATITGLSYGIYTVTVTDAKGCSITLSTVVNDPHCLNLQATTTVTNPHCHGGTGSILGNATGGTLPYSYSWSNGQTTATATGCTAGTYTLTVTDGTGCVDVQGAVVTQPSQLTNVMNHTDVTVIAGSNGTATANPAGGTSPYTYAWSNGGTTASINGLSAGTYSVTITDNAGCSLIDSVHIYDPNCSHIVLNVYGTNVSCHGGSNGTATAQVLFGTPPYTYHWSNGATTPSISGLSAGVYSVVAYGSSLCPLFGSVTITEPASLSLGVAATNITCAPVDNGTIDLTVSGGTFPYSFSWSNGIHVEDLNLLTNGVYSVTVTDANSCTATASATITRPAALTSSGTKVDVTCYGGSNGSVNATVSGGVSPYTYSWSNGAITEDLSGLTSAEYILTATDANGCVVSPNLSMLVDQPEVVRIDSAHVACPVAGSGVASVTVYPHGGNNGPYQISFNNGVTFLASGVYTTSLPVGTTYSVYAKDGNGCMSSLYSITVKPAVSISAIAYSKCFATGTTTTLVTVIPAGGAGGSYQVSFNNGSTFGAYGTYTATLPIATTYNIVVRDSSGCLSVPSTIVIPNILSVTNSVSTYAGGYNVHCNGSTDGTITLVPTGGTSPLTYSWSGPSGFTSTSQNLTGLAAGSYTVTITDANACTITRNITLTQPALLSATISSPTVAGGYNITCSGSSNGSINLSVSGGATPYTYTWTGPSGFTATTQNLTGLAAGSYIVTITDANGCSTVKNITLTQPNVLANVLSSPTVAGGYNITCNGSTNGSITNTVSGGVSPYTYAWSGPSGYTSTVQSPTGLAAGTYTVVVTDANGCTSTRTIVLTQPAVLAGTVSSPTVAGGYNITCNGSATGSINLSITGGTPTYTYEWSGPSGYTSTTQNPSGLFAGSYTVAVTDANGCTVVRNITLTQPAVLTSSVSSPTVAGGFNITCNGAFTGSINTTVAGGTSPYTYAWTGPAGYTSTLQNPVGLQAGPYVLVITDANGCTVIKNITLTQPSLLTNSLSSPTVAGGYNITCNGASNGSIVNTVSGGVTAYTYAWTGPAGFTSTIQSPTGLIAGTYNVTVTDANGCTTTASINLTEPSVLASTISSPTVAGGYNITCNGASNGSINLGVTGGTVTYTYAWSGPSGFTSTVQNPNALIAGTYNVTVTDANGCNTNNSIILTEPAVLSATATSPTVPGGNNITCFGASNGSINLTVSGGTSSYSFAWTGPAAYTSTSQDITGLVAGSYGVTITDQNACTANTTITLTQPAVLGTVLTSDTVNGGYNISCFGNNDGTAYSAVSGGTPSFIYAWTGPASFTANTANIDSLIAGTYVLSVTDTNGCVKMDSITLTAPITLTGNLTSATYNGGYNVTCNGSTNGSITLTVNGGQTPYTYAWSNGANTQNISGIGAGNYSVIVSDTNHCSFTQSITLTEPAVLTDTTYSPTVVGGYNISCFGAANGTIDLGVNGGTSPYTTTWTGPGSYAAFTEDISALTAGTYTVAIIDNNGCTDTAIVVLTEPTAMSSTITATTVAGGYNITCFGNSNGSVNLTAGGGTPGYTFTWNGPAGFTSNLEDPSGLLAGNYLVTVVDSNSCALHDTISLTEPEALVSTAILSNYNGNNISCMGSNTGSINFSINGGTSAYNFNWTAGSGFTANTEDIDSLLAGSYSVTVTDANGCTLDTAFTLTEPTALGSNITTTPATCSAPTGSADLSINGGTTPYTTSWSNGTTSEDLNNVLGGNYVVTITDANGCTHTDSTTINSISIMSISAQVNGILCYGESNGSIALEVNNGTKPFTYNWSSVGTTGSSSVDSLPAGNYIVNVIDASGCVVADTFNIVEASQIQIALSSPTYTGGYNISGYQGTDGSIDLTATGGFAPYSYLWSNNQTSENLNFLSAGNYTVIVTDSMGCNTLASIKLTEPLPLEMPTGFSPNGDGKNDNFVIHGIEIYPDNELVIYNRWGNIVNSFSGYNNEWDGTSNNGEWLPNGTYFVILKIHGTDIVLTGYVDLRK